MIMQIDEDITVHRRPGPEGTTRSTEWAFTQIESGCCEWTPAKPLDNLDIMCLFHDRKLKVILWHKLMLLSNRVVQHSEFDILIEQTPDTRVHLSFASIFYTGRTHVSIEVPLSSSTPLPPNTLRLDQTTRLKFHLRYRPVHVLQLAKRIERPVPQGSSFAADEFQYDLDPLIKLDELCERSSPFEDIEFEFRCGTKIKGIRYVFGQSCKFFSDLLYPQGKTGPPSVFINWTEAEAFNIIKRFIYKFKLHVSDGDQLVQFLHALKHIEFPFRTDLFFASMITLENAFTLLTIAHILQDESSMDVCLKYIDTNADRLIDSFDFNYLSRRMVHTIIARNTLKIGETKILKAVIGWGKFQFKFNPVKKCEDDSPLCGNIEDLLALIRYQKVPQQKFADLLREHRFASPGFTSDIFLQVYSSGYPCKPDEPEPTWDDENWETFKKTLPRPLRQVHQVQPGQLVQPAQSVQSAQSVQAGQRVFIRSVSSPHSSSPAAQYQQQIKLVTMANNHNVQPSSNLNIQPLSTHNQNQQSYASPSLNQLQQQVATFRSQTSVNHTLAATFNPAQNINAPLANNRIASSSPTVMASLLNAQSTQYHQVPRQVPAQPSHHGQINTTSPAPPYTHENSHPHNVMPPLNQMEPNNQYALSQQQANRVYGRTFSGGNQQNHLG